MFKFQTATLKNHMLNTTPLVNIRNLTFNKFEVSKIYMTACMCIYKFCQTKEYLFMIFFCFIQKPEGYFYDSS